jgi:hypothetical protein
VTVPEAEPLYDDDSGEHVGWTQEQDDGGILAYDVNGELLGAAYGQDWYEVNELEYADDTGGQAAALEQRLDALEHAALEPREATYYPVPVEPEPDPERMTASLMQQAAHLEARLGRPLTQSEKRHLGQALTEDEVAGADRPDLQGAADRLAAEGREIPDIDSGSVHQQRAKRQQLMSDLMADRERADAAESNGDDQLSDIAPPSQEAYDLDDREQRQRYLLDRLEGREVSPDDAFSGSDYEDAGLWEEGA